MTAALDNDRLEVAIADAIVDAWRRDPDTMGGATPSTPDRLAGQAAAAAVTVILERQAADTPAPRSPFPVRVDLSIPQAVALERLAVRWVATADAWPTVDDLTVAGRATVNLVRYAAHRLTRALDLLDPERNHP